MFDGDVSMISVNAINQSINSIHLSPHVAEEKESELPASVPNRNRGRIEAPGIARSLEPVPFEDHFQDDVSPIPPIDANNAQNVDVSLPVPQQNENNVQLSMPPLGNETLIDPNLSAIESAKNESDGVQGL